MKLFIEIAADHGMSVQYTNANLPYVTINNLYATDRFCSDLRAAGINYNRRVVVLEPAKIWIIGCIV